MTPIVVVEKANIPDGYVMEFELTQDSVQLTDVWGPRSNKVSDEVLESIREDIQSDWFQFLNNNGLKLIEPIGD